MKRTIVLLTLLVIYTSVHAQLSKNTIMLGGAINAYANSTDYKSPSPYTYRNSNVSLEPYAGIFISEKSAVGLRLGLANTKYSSEYDTYTTKNNNTSFSVGFFYRQYFPLAEKFAFFLNGSMSYGNGKETFTNTSSATETTTKTKTISASVSPGLNYFINNRWGVEARFGSIYYSNGKSESDDESAFTYSDTTSNGFGLNFSLNTFSLGLQYFISR